MKKLLFILLVIPVLSFAEEDLDAKLTQACERHSASLVARIKSDVINNISQTEAQQMMDLSVESCTAYFRRVFNQQAVAQTETKKEESEEEKGWLSDKIFTGDGERNKGHERLQRR